LYFIVFILALVSFVQTYGITESTHKPSLMMNWQGHQWKKTIARFQQLCKRKKKLFFCFFHYSREISTSDR